MSTVNFYATDPKKINLQLHMVTTALSELGYFVSLLNIFSKGDFKREVSESSDPYARASYELLNQSDQFKKQYDKAYEAGDIILMRGQLDLDFCKECFSLKKKQRKAFVDWWYTSRRVYFSEESQFNIYLLLNEEDISELPEAEQSKCVAYQQFVLDNSKLLGVIPIVGDMPEEICSKILEAILPDLYYAKADEITFKEKERKE